MDNVTPPPTEQLSAAIYLDFIGFDMAMRMFSALFWGGAIRI